MAAAEQRRRLTGRRTIVFVDEIHRFNKAQQDAFLPRVESGDIVLIGATTENPSFEVNAALLSRSKVFVLKPLDEHAIVAILKRALTDVERGLGRDNPEADEEALWAMARFANGDARAALNVLQLTVSAAQQPAGRPRIDRALLEKTLTNKMLLYDKTGEEHYNLMSALHKSMRNSDADASIYWLARMLEAGEDPKYVARRLIRFASEDIGNADPQALADHGRRQGCGAFHRDAGGQYRPRPGGALSRHRAEEQRGLHGLQRCRRSGEDRRRRARAAAYPQRPDEVDEAARLRQGL